MSQGRRKLKKSVRKHGWFAAAILALLVILIIGYSLAPRSESNRSWHIPQVQPG